MSGDADRQLLRRIRALPHRRGTDRLLRALSQATDHGRGWVLVTAAGAAVDGRRRRQWLRASATLIASERASRAIKGAVGRPRPRLDGLPPLAPVPDPLSFPSSHTANAVAAAIVLPPLLPAAPLWVMAAVTAASRPYLGVHYPSDVLGGVALGVACGRLALWTAESDGEQVARVRRRTSGHGERGIERSSRLVL